MLNNFLKYPAILICCFIMSICNVSKSDETVTEIQTMLKNQGYSIGVIDGKAGKNTIREIKNWQYINNFDQSGNINQDQLSLMRIQYADKKKLNNEELKLILERNKKIEKKIKKKSKNKDNWWVRNITELMDFVIGASMILGAIGFIIGVLTNPGTDGRTRTGYKGNVVPEFGLFFGGILLFAFGSALLYFQDKNFKIAVGMLLLFIIYLVLKVRALILDE